MRNRNSDLHSPACTCKRCNDERLAQLGMTPTPYTPEEPRRHQVPPPQRKPDPSAARAKRERQRKSRELQELLHDTEQMLANTPHRLKRKQQPKNRMPERPKEKPVEKREHGSIWGRGGPDEIAEKAFMLLAGSALSIGVGYGIYFLIDKLSS